MYKYCSDINHSTTVLNKRKFANYHGNHICTHPNHNFSGKIIIKIYSYVSSYLFVGNCLIDSINRMRFDFVTGLNVRST